MVDVPGESREAAFLATVKQPIISIMKSSEIWGSKIWKFRFSKWFKWSMQNCRTCNGNVWKLPDSVASFFPLFFLIKLFLWEFCWVGVPTVSPVSAVVGTSSFPSTKPGQWHRRGMGEVEATQSGLSSGTTNGWWNSGCQPSFVPFFGLTIRVNVLNCWGLTSCKCFCFLMMGFIFLLWVHGVKTLEPQWAIDLWLDFPRGQSGQGICTNWYNFLKSNPW